MIITPVNVDQLLELSGIVGTILYSSDGATGFLMVVPGWNIVYNGTQAELSQLIQSGSDLRQVAAISLEGTPTPP
jgi:hypothetical protein